MHRRLLRFLSVASFLLFANDLFAQNITLKGIITDTSFVGIPNAYLTISVARDSSFIAFKLSETSGRYQIQLNNPQKLRLIVSAVGFENFVQAIDIQKDTIINFRLKQSIKVLDEVKVVAQRPATFKEDTATFNANFYRTPADKNLNDLLKKLPGVEVNQGKIFVQGQEVKNLMIEGEELYENNPKILSNALSAEMVDKIQIIDNFQDPNNPNSLNTSKKALNIKIREDKKNIPTGSVMGGGGVPENYLFNTNLFLFRPKTKWNVLANTNNVGKSIFTFEDYLQFSGKLEDLISGGGGRLQISTDDLPQGILQDNILPQKVNLTMTAASLAHQFTSKLKLKNHTIYNHSSARENLGLTRLYSNFLNSPYLESQQINRQSEWIESKTSLRYTPNKKDNIVYNFKLNYANNQRNSIFNNRFLEVNNSSNENKTNNQFNFTNQLQWTHLYSSKNSLTIDFKYLYLSDKQSFSVNSSQDAFGELLNLSTSKPLIPLSYREANNQPLQQFSIEISNKRKLNKSWTLNTNFGLNKSKEKSDFEIFNTESSSIWKTDLLNQSGDFSLQKAFAGLMFKWQYKKADVTLGTSINQYDLLFNGVLNQAKINTFQLEPSVLGRLKFSQSHSLSFGYNFSNTLPEMQQLNEGYFIESFRKISKGNRDLSLSQRHNFNIQYFLFDLFHHVNATFFGRFSINKNPIRNNNFTDIRRDFYQFVNINQDYNSQLNAILGKDFYTIPVSVKVGSEWSVFDSQNLFNNVVNPFKNETIAYQLSVNTRFKGFFNFEGSFKNTFRKLKTNLSENVLRNQIQKISGAITIKPSDKFLLKYQTDFITLKKENVSASSLTLMNLSAEYHLNKKVLIVFEGYNLLNNREVNDATVSPIFSQTQSRSILGAYGLISFEFRF